MGDLLNDILRAADKHPNSRVSKLIRTVEDEPSQKNIVLLLIELSEHAEYATDFNISLRYYLELFESLGINRDLILNEAGLLLVNSSKIYSKRVDYVQSLVERQILTLSNADHEIQQQKEQNEQESSAESATPVEKPKRGRKRAIDAPTDPYEVQLEPKKFKKMTQEKRFALPKTPTKPKSLLRNIELEQQIHPAGWLHATIYDLENDEDVDTKRNYKLFTYHVEHRYNTLVPDINFRLHFKVKDYMDAQEEEMDDNDEATNHCNDVWPPLSEAYVQKYIHLENHVLQQEIDPSTPWKSPQRLKNVSPTNAAIVETNETANNVDTTLQILNTSIANDNSNINDSGLGTSVLESSIDASQLDTTVQESTLNNKNISQTDSDKTLNSSQSQENDSALGASVLSSTMDASQLDITGHESTLSNTTISQSDADKSLNSTQAQENDSALGESMLDQSNNLNETNKELCLSNETSENDKSLLNITTVVNETSLPTTQLIQTTNDADTDVQITTANSERPKETEDASKLDSGKTNENAAPNLENKDAEKNVEVSSSEGKDVVDNSAIICGSSELGKETSSSEVKDNTDASIGISENSDIRKQTSSAAACVMEATKTTNTIAGNCISSENTKEKESAEESSQNSKENSGENLIEQNKDSTQGEPPLAIIESSDKVSADGIQQSSSAEGSNESEVISNGEPSPTTVETTKEKDAFLQLEIHVLNENENEPSERLQLRIPNTDDEGVHLTDDENDLRLLSPTIKLSNIMPGVTSKDVTIFLDKELREALELRDGMLEHFSQETYKVPVVEEPKEHPLLFNILKLPPKILRKKVLFKLGPDMDLFLKARSLKIVRPVPAPREYRRQLQFFPLSNTDMTGIIDTPPNSPGHCSDFCGFTDDEVMQDESTCTEFCGFSDDEQNILKVNTHRLSRDSGVGADVTTLTPEKETLKIIFEETDADIIRCKVDLNKQFANVEGTPLTMETTEELLNELSASVRTALEAEIADKTTTDGVEVDKETTIEVEVVPNTSTNGINCINDCDKNGEATEQTNVPLDTIEVSKESNGNDSSEITIEVEIIPDSIKNGENCVNDSDNNGEERLATKQLNVPLDATILSKVINENDTLNESNTNKGTTQEQENSTTNFQENVEAPSANNTGETIANTEEKKDTSLETKSSSEELNKNCNTQSEESSGEQTNNSVESVKNVSEEQNGNQEITLNNEPLNEQQNTDAIGNLEDVTKTAEVGLCKDVPSTYDILPAPITISRESDNDSDNSQQDNDFFNINLQGTKTKIQQWHEHLRPILAKSRERHHFDVFQLGTEIIDTIQEANDEEQNNRSETTFDNIMDSKDKSYVSRYFLSTLLLANQSNVNILLENKSSENPSAWCDIKLELLSTKRHTVAIEDNIGMINNKKRKQNLPSDEKVMKKKSKSSNVRLDLDDEDSLEESEPLVNMQTSKNKLKGTPSKRSMNYDASNVSEKKFRDTANSAVTNAKQLQIISVQHLLNTQTNLLLDVPATSSQANGNVPNCEVNLNNIRLLQPIEKVPRQGDDYDSGIFSLGEMSTS